MSLSSAASERRADAGLPSRLRRLCVGLWCVIRPRRRRLYHIALDGMLPEAASSEWLIAFANERLRTGIIS